MTFIRDEDIAAMVREARSLASGVNASDFEAKDAAIQACTIDLTIGGIFLPGVEDDKLGSSVRPLKELSLTTGATAVIRTKEKLTMPDDVGGIAVPPNHVSINGLLMTNPGHVDPGYEGPVHLTVINMGKKPYPLKQGDRIVRVLLFRLNALPAKSYRQRRPGPGRPLITEELLGKLSGDFVDVTARAEASVKKQIHYAEIRAKWVPVVAVIAGGLITFFVNRYTGPDVEEVSRKVDVLAAKVDSLGGSVNLGEVQKQIEELRKKINP